MQPLQIPARLGSYMLTQASWQSATCTRGSQNDSTLITDCYKLIYYFIFSSWIGIFYYGSTTSPETLELKKAKNVWERKSKSTKPSLNIHNYFQLYPWGANSQNTKAGGTWFPFIIRGTHFSCSIEYSCFSLSRYTLHLIVISFVLYSYTRRGANNL